MNKILHTTEFKKLYAIYDRMVQAKGYKTGCGTMYQSNLMQFLSWMEQKSIIEIDQIKSEQVKQYLDHLITRPNIRRGGTLSPSTINHHLFSLRLFFNHLLDTNYCKEVVNIPNNVARNNKQHSTLTEDEIKLLYHHSETQLDRAILSIAYGCGLRRNELAQLNVNDLSISKGLLQVKHGKGNKHRDVPMSDAVIKDVQDYLHTQRMNCFQSREVCSNAYFLNRKGERLSGDHINKTLKHIVTRTGNSELIEKKVSLHCLRHSIATHLVDRGLDMLTIRLFLGHTEIDTSSIYMARRKRKNKYQI